MFSLRHHTARIVLTAAAALGTAFVPAAAASAKVRCQPSGSHTILANGFARVFAKNSAAFVCLKSSGRITQLQNADPAADTFALGGKYVGWSSSDPSDATVPPHSIITVMHIPTRSVDSNSYPFQTNETVDKIVVLRDGAAAWAMTPSDGSFTQVQGTDRANHPADQFSDDHTDLVGSSLHLISGKTIGWTYSDGTHGTQALY